MQTPQQECVAHIVEETLTFWLERCEAGDAASQDRFADALRAMATVDPNWDTLSAIEWLARKVQVVSQESIGVAALNGLLLMYEDAADKEAFAVVVRNSLDGRPEAVLVRTLLLAILLRREGYSAQGLETALQEQWKRLQAEKRVLLARELVAAPNHAGRLAHFLQNPPEDMLPALRAALLLMALGALPGAARRSEIAALLQQGLTHRCWFIGQVAAELLAEHGLAAESAERQATALKGENLEAQLCAVSALGRLAAASHSDSPALLQALRSPDIRLRAAAIEAIAQTLGACPTAGFTAALESLRLHDPLLAPLASAALQRLQIPWKPELTLTQTLWNALFPLARAFAYETARLDYTPRALTEPGDRAEVEAVLALFEPKGAVEHARQEIEKAVHASIGRTSTAYAVCAIPTGILVLFTDSASGESSAADALRIVEKVGKSCRSALALTQVALHRGKVGLKQREGVWEIGGGGWEVVRSLNTLGEPNSILATLAVVEALPGSHPARMMLHAQGYWKVPDQGQFALSTYWNRQTGVGNAAPPPLLQSTPAVQSAPRRRLPKMRYIALPLCALAGGAVYLLAPDAAARLVARVKLTTQTFTQKSGAETPKSPAKQGKSPDASGFPIAKDSKETSVLPAPPVDDPPNAPPEPKHDPSDPLKGEPVEQSYHSPSIRIYYNGKVYAPDRRISAAQVGTQEDLYSNPVDVKMVVQVSGALPDRIQVEVEDNVGFEVTQTARNPKPDPIGYHLSNGTLTLFLGVHRPLFKVLLRYCAEDGTELDFHPTAQVFRMPAIKPSPEEPGSAGEPPPNP